MSRLGFSVSCRAFETAWAWTRCGEPSLTKERDDLVGNVVAGTYRVLERLGEGDLGPVYAAKDVTRERHVALKLLRPELSRSPEYLAEFQRNLRAGSVVSHEGLVTVLAYGGDPVLRRLFVARELTGGADASQLVATKGPLPPVRAVRIATEILEALQAVHERGLVHGRLSSRKVRLEDGAQARITGLGLAGPVVPRDPNVPHRSPSPIALAYRAPEQVRGEPTDARADLYAVGTLLSELLDGRTPVVANTTQELKAALLEDVLARPERPPALDATIRRALARRPAERFPDARSFSRALADALR
jgi:serine/threonine-protein kinase